MNPCEFHGIAADGREVGWSYGDWWGDSELRWKAHTIRGDDRTLRGTAAAIAAAVGEGGHVSESVTALLADNGT